MNKTSKKRNDEQFKIHPKTPPNTVQNLDNQAYIATYSNSPCIQNYT